MDPGLLKAIKRRITEQVGGMVGRVFITAEDGLIQPEVAFPCVGVRDGGTEYSFLDAERYRLVHTVHLDAYVMSLRDVEAQVVGGPGVGEKGSVGLVQDLRESLKGQLLEAEGATGVEDAMPVAETATGLLIGGEGEAVVRKTLTMRYRQLLAV